MTPQLFACRMCSREIYSHLQIRQQAKRGFRHCTRLYSNYWYKVYHERKKYFRDLPEQTESNINPKAIFANNEICLSDISVYGFDYDYTIAQYTNELHQLLFELGRDALLHNHKYPEGIIQKDYDPEFAIRGLHYDTRKGLLMKIDSYHHIQLGTVYRGTNRLSDHEVLQLYGGTHVNLEDMNTFYGSGPMHQLVDMFAPPEMNLLINVMDYFIENNIPYDPEYVFYDVRNAVQGVHMSGLLHQRIIQDLDRFLEKDTEMKEFLERLQGANKKLFMITNSGFPFMDPQPDTSNDAGMRHMMGKDWRDLFDIVIVQARKPKFFNRHRPFRVYDPKRQEESWGRVKHLDKGQVYLQGNLESFQHMTGWFGAKVLYLGDHVYSDLADPSLKHGWRTGAIISELETEVNTLQTREYKAALQWLTVLQYLLEEMQETGTKESLDMIPRLLDERAELRDYLKTQCNSRFGSLFRTHHNPSYFSRRLGRFADIYTSKLTNLLFYSVNHTFYPRRISLPHEPYPFGDASQCTTCSKSFTRAQSDVDDKE